MNYNKLLLDELRLVTYTPNASAALTEDLLAKAITLNENLQTLGYVLNPVDLAALAVSPSLDGFYNKVCSMMDQVPAQPMYPGFPEQVMEMDEAVFRFHQMVHYFSTYGMELLFDVPVQHGWLPYETPEKPAKNAASPDVATPNAASQNANSDHTTITPQTIVLSAKTIKLLPESDAYLVPLQMIFSRRERMTLPEQEIISAAISQVTPAEAAALTIGFKKNLTVVYGIVFRMENREDAFSILRGMCQHTGDVLRCVDILLGQNKFHFRTSQKRFLVKLLESYPANDFRANLILSGKSAERNLLLLNYLDYSVYSRSAAHMSAVDALRDGKLRSWESICKSMLATGDEGALDFIAQRPGMMLRMVAWLMRLGYEPAAISSRLREKVSALSTQTLVTNLNHFGKLLPSENADAERLYDLFEGLLVARMAGFNTALQGKKVMLSMDEYNLAASELQCNSKSAEGGFIRSGIAYRIPENVGAVRFFVYWNDQDRVDVDLHAMLIDLNQRVRPIGWDTSFRDCGAVFSGDITHSNAAEYIDVDLDAPIDKVFANIRLFSGKPSFGEIDTCYVGMMAVPEDAYLSEKTTKSYKNTRERDEARRKIREENQHSELYSEANCFFKHNLRGNCLGLNYGYIDVQNRCLIFDGQPIGRGINPYSGREHRKGRLSLERYLQLLLEAQNVTLCETEEEADVVLVMGQPRNEKEVSLIETNFFMP